jgi:hypothetical protein
LKRLAAYFTTLAPRLGTGDKESITGCVALLGVAFLRTLRKRI